MRKISLAILLCLIGLSLVACDQDENEQENIEEYIYESPYTKNYDFSIEIINEVYYNYHDSFAGVYLVDGEYNLNVTEDIPHVMITRLEQNSLVTHHIVNFSYAELWTVEEIVKFQFNDFDRYCSIGISEMDNSVILRLITDTEIPSSFNHYIEIGILTIYFQDEYATVTE